MNNYEPVLFDVYNAAKSLLDAHENQMVTSEEWDALQHAVASCTQPPPGEHGDQRDESFSIAENILTRHVVPAEGRGKRYAHTCDLDVFENVAHAIDELNGASFTFEIIRAATNAPFSQVAVAIAFLKERGCVVPTQRRHHAAATDSVHLDAMVEWAALAQSLAT